MNQRQKMENIKNEYSDEKDGLKLADYDEEGNLESNVMKNRKNPYRESTKILDIINLEDDKKNIKLSDLQKSFYAKRFQTNTLEKVPVTAYTACLRDRRGNKNFITQEIKHVINQFSANDRNLLKRYGVDTKDQNKLALVAKDVIKNGYENLAQAWLDDCFLDIDN